MNESDEVNLVHPDETSERLPWIGFRVAIHESGLILREWTSPDFPRRDAQKLANVLAMLIHYLWGMAHELDESRENPSDVAVIDLIRKVWRQDADDWWCDTCGAIEHDGWVCSCCGVTIVKKDEEPH